MTILGLNKKQSGFLAAAIIVFVVWFFFIRKKKSSSTEVAAVEQEIDESPYNRTGLGGYKNREWKKIYGSAAFGSHPLGY